MRTRRKGTPLTGADRVTVAVGALSLVGGVLVLALASGFGAMIAGIALLGLAGVAFVSLAFLLVGESEDRDREEPA
jgi:hypothetical protein